MGVLDRIFLAKSTFVEGGGCDRPEYAHLDGFIAKYEKIVEKDSKKPIYTQTQRFNEFEDKDAFLKRYEQRVERQASLQRYKTSQGIAGWDVKTKHGVSSEDLLNQKIQESFNKLTDENYDKIINETTFDLRCRMNGVVADIFCKRLYKKIRYDTRYHNIYFKWLLKMNEVISDKILSNVIEHLLKVIKTRSHIFERIETTEKDDAKFQLKREFISSVEFLICIITNGHMDINTLWETWLTDKDEYTSYDIEALYNACKIYGAGFPKDITDKFKINLREKDNNPRVMFFISDIENSLTKTLENLRDEFIQGKITAHGLGNWLRNVSCEDDELLGTTIDLLLTAPEKQFKDQTIYWYLHTLFAHKILIKNHVKLILEDLTEITKEEPTDEAFNLLATVMNIFNKICCTNVCDKSLAQLFVKTFKSADKSPDVWTKFLNAMRPVSVSRDAKMILFNNLKPIKKKGLVISSAGVAYGKKSGKKHKQKRVHKLKPQTTNLFALLDDGDDDED